MRLLLDECLPRKLKSLFISAEHNCETVREAGWEGVTNGKLLAQAELLFDVLITVDKNLRYQQTFQNRVISVFGIARKIESYRRFGAAYPRRSQCAQIY
jgi:predicted nuclease of predicted toxin-antitoxin system